jgi:hypothetical protein
VKKEKRRKNGQTLDLIGGERANRFFHHRRHQHTSAICNFLLSLATLMLEGIVVYLHNHWIDAFVDAVWDADFHEFSVPRPPS